MQTDGLARGASVDSAAGQAADAPPWFLFGTPVANMRF
jgi:hypothetical protein